MVTLESLHAGHADALLAFETENRAYFSQSVPDRGDDYFADFPALHAELLAEQQAGLHHFHVLVDERGVVRGRVNLVHVTGQGAAELGYRIGQRAVGRGLATAAVRDVCARARTTYGLSVLTAATTEDNPASASVLRRTGFLPAGDTELGGRPGKSFRKDLADAPAGAQTEHALADWRRDQSFSVSAPPDRR